MEKWGENKNNAQRKATIFVKENKSREGKVYGESTERKGRGQVKIRNFVLNFNL